VQVVSRDLESPLRQSVVIEVEHYRHTGGRDLGGHDQGRLAAKLKLIRCIMARTTLVETINNLIYSRLHPTCESSLHNLFKSQRTLSLPDYGMIA